MQQLTQKLLSVFVLILQNKTDKLQNCPNRLEVISETLEFSPQIVQGPCYQNWRVQAK